MVLDHNSLFPRPLLFFVFFLRPSHPWLTRLDWVSKASQLINTSFILNIQNILFVLSPPLIFFVFSLSGKSLFPTLFPPRRAGRRTLTKHFLPFPASSLLIPRPSRGYFPNFFSPCVPPLARSFFYNQEMDSVFHKVPSLFHSSLRPGFQAHHSIVSWWRGPFCPAN